MLRGKWVLENSAERRCALTVRAGLARVADWARGYAPRWLARSLLAPRPASKTSPRTAGERALPRWLGGHLLSRRAREQVRWEQAAEGSLWYRAAKHARPSGLDTTIPAEGADVPRSTRLLLVAAARDMVGLKMNLPEDKLQGLLAALPALRKPTIAHLSVPGWVAVALVAFNWWVCAGISEIDNVCACSPPRSPSVWPAPIWIEARP